MRILVISPHPDDAELGAGATIKKLIDNKIYWITFSPCSESISDGFPKDIMYKEFEKVCELYQVAKSFMNDFPVRRYSNSRQEILELLIGIRNEFNPELVIGPSLNDTHQDHVVVANEMLRAFKNTSIISYELPWNNLVSRTDYFEIVTEKQIEFKIKALSLYQSQIAKKRPYTESEYIRSLARVRGAQINQEYAESFELIRMIR